jgi:hypothetical protein
VALFLSCACLRVRSCASHLLSDAGGDEGCKSHEIISFYILVFITHASLHYDFFEKSLAPLFFPFTNLHLRNSASLLTDMFPSQSPSPSVSTVSMTATTLLSMDFSSSSTLISSHETSTSRPQPLFPENEENRSHQDLPIWVQSIEPAPEVMPIALMAARLEHQMLDIIGMPLLNNNTAGIARRIRYRCCLCGLLCTRQQDLRRHINFKHPMRTYACTYNGCA